MTVPLSTANARETAARILAAWLRTGAFPDRELERVRENHAFAMELTLGVVRRFGSLDWLRHRCAPRRPEPEVEAAILVGFYQLLFLDDVADYAAVHATVEVARRMANERAASFVNALLRRAAAEGKDWMAALERQPPPIRLSHPAELIERWTRQFGRRNALRLCEWNNERPDVALRPRPRRLTLPDALALLKAAGIAAEPHPFDPARFLILPRGIAVADVPGFAEGDYYAQDPATAVAVDLLDPRPGETVLDACAAPGGKTLLMAERLAGRGRLIAADVHEDRLARLRENLARTGHAEIALVRADAAGAKLDAFRAALGGNPAFDAILLDAPCSNTGVIRRRPDARWNFSRGRLARLRAQQERILENVARWVRPGGRLLYSTCSLEPEEDEELMLAWTARHPEWRRVRARKLFPPDTRTDGAYVALLHRASPFENPCAADSE